MRHVLGFTVVASLSIALSGCFGSVVENATKLAGQAAEQSAEAARAQADASQAQLLRQLGMTYHDYHDAFKQGPPDWDTCAAFAAERGRDSAAIRQLRESAYTVAWSMRFRDITIGSSNYVLAYPPGASESGGVVLMMDGTTMTLSGPELQAALANQSSIQPVTETSQVESTVASAPAQVAAGDSSESADGQSSSTRSPSRTTAPRPDESIPAPKVAPPARNNARISAEEPGVGGVTEATRLAPGDKLFGKWGASWYDVEVVAVLKDGQVRIHYDGWSSTWDEDVPRSNLRLKEHTPDTRGDNPFESATAPRTWTDSTGQFRIDAELMDVQEGQVRLKKTDGTTITVPIEKLSAADQAIVRQEVAKRSGRE